MTPGTGAAGTLGVPALERFWRRTLDARSGRAPQLHPDDLRADDIVLAGLRIGVRETLDVIIRDQLSFEDFERWVVERNGGTIEPWRIERLNEAIDGTGTFQLESILAEPVLSAAELASWDELGYAVVKGAVPRAACDAAVDAICEHVGISMSDPTSWHRADLWVPLAHHPALWANRDSPRIHTAFAQLWGSGDLWMNVDVCGVNAPVHGGITFRGTPLHWDMTLAPPVRFGTQAILYLTDTAEDQGAFSCVPGFHHQLDAWLAKVPAGTDPRALATETLSARPIAGEAGDLIIWNQALPHAVTPNHAGSPRIVQYLNMFSSGHQANVDWC